MQYRRSANLKEASMVRPVGRQHRRSVKARPVGAHRPRRAAGTDPAPAAVSPKRRQTRQRLLAAAFDVFAERGFGQSTIEDVCEKAGFTRGAFYSNFASLEQLFHSMYADQATGVTERVRAALARAGETATPADLVTAAIDGLPLDRRWQLVKTDYVLHAARHQDAAPALVAHQDAVVDLLAEALTPVLPKVRSAGQLADPHELARAMIAVHDGILAGALSGADEGELRARLEAALTALVGG